MFRLTELAETVTKEYLFSKTDIIYIGEEYGQAAVFQEKGTNRLYCELFPHGGSVYIRLCGKSEARLIRRKQTAPLSENAIQLCSGIVSKHKLAYFFSNSSKKSEDAIKQRKDVWLS